MKWTSESFLLHCTFQYGLRAMQGIRHCSPPCHETLPASNSLYPPMPILLVLLIPHPGMLLLHPPGVRHIRRSYVREETPPPFSLVAKCASEAAQQGQNRLSAHVYLPSTCSNTMGLVRHRWIVLKMREKILRKAKKLPISSRACGIHGWLNLSCILVACFVCIQCICLLIQIAHLSY